MVVYHFPIVTSVGRNHAWYPYSARIPHVYMPLAPHHLQHASTARAQASDYHYQYNRATLADKQKNRH